MELKGYEFPSLDRLAEYLSASPLAHRNLRLSKSGTYVGDGRLVAKYALIPNLHAITHEIAHVIDFYRCGAIERCGVLGFGMGYPEVEVLGQRFPQPETTRALRCELRVFAIQAHLLFGVLEVSGLDELHGFFEDSAHTLATSAYAMEDVFAVPRRRGITRKARADHDRVNGRYQRGEIDYPTYSDAGLLSYCVRTYERDRFEYALKYLVRDYQNDTPERVLADYRAAMEHSIFEEAGVKEKKAA
ncbi:hypothetical protein [Thioalkalivibrio sp. ALE19]|uniref:hypothetical protein n=1 Tax=Thioalkalivibrio sp. ALE19 TaxID=1266909 RepID=UPI000418503C|nr:hypothetical protein [Thioalkalivibrio sp. ALE19]